MTVTLNVRLDPADRARADAVLAELARRATNPAGGLRIVGRALVSEQERRFQSQTAPDGKAWAKLKPLTVLLRGARGPILRRSGALMESSNAQVSGMTLRVGVNTIYAAVQHFGATIVPKNGAMLAIPIGAARITKSHGGLILRKGAADRPAVVMARKVTIPARPIVGFGAKDEAAARSAIEGWLAVEGGG